MLKKIVAKVIATQLSEAIRIASLCKTSQITTKAACDELDARASELVEVCEGFDITPQNCNELDSALAYFTGLMQRLQNLN